MTPKEASEELEGVISDIQNKQANDICVNTLRKIQKFILMYPFNKEKIKSKGQEPDIGLSWRGL